MALTVFLRAYLYMLPTLVFLGMILPGTNLLIQAVSLAMITTVFLFASTVKALGIMPGRSVLWFGLGRFYTFFSLPFLFVILYIAVGVPIVYLTDRLLQVLPLPEEVIFIPLMMLLSYPILKRFWPVLAIALVVPEEAGYRRVALGLTGNFWVGPGMMEVFRWTASTGAMRFLHVPPLIAIHAMLLTLFIYSTLPVQSPWVMPLQIGMLFGLLPVTVFILTVKCWAFWEYVNPLENS